MINDKLIEYTKKYILPEYDKNEKAHGKSHIIDVIERSIELSKNYDVNLDMVYTIAMYHDIGHHIDAKKHEIVSAEIFEKDENMKQFFNEEERKIIKEAIEDHRASAKTEPRSIYGKIISSADRGIPSIENGIEKSYWYHKKHKPNCTEKEVKEGIYNHLKEKFGKNGYAKIYIVDEKYEKARKEFIDILENEKEFRKRIDEVIEDLQN